MAVQTGAWKAELVVWEAEAVAHWAMEGALVVASLAKVAVEAFQVDLAAAAASAAAETPIAVGR